MHRYCHVVIDCREVTAYADGGLLLKAGTRLHRLLPIAFAACRWLLLPDRNGQPLPRASVLAIGIVGHL